MKHYYLESSQSDRIAFDQMIERTTEEALDSLELKVALYYCREDRETYIGIGWDQLSGEYDDDLDYAEEMGLRYVEDMQEAKGRFYAAAKIAMKDWLTANS